MAAQRGVSLIELTIAMALTLAVAVSVFAAVRAGTSGFAIGSEAADLQQRLRVAAASIGRDLASAGAGPVLDGMAAPLILALPPVLPFRQGALDGDPSGTVRSDTITVVAVPAAGGKTTLRTDAGPGSLRLDVLPQANCPAGINLCGFASGTTVLVFDRAGSYDVLLVSAVADGLGQMTIASRPARTASATYAAGSTVASVQLHAYYLKTDPVTQASQLVHDDGSGSPAAPVVDHVVSLRFDYLGEPRPPALTALGATYGPAPPPAVGNCLFAVDGESGESIARLVALGADDDLVALGAGQLTDGPWCPDETNGNRWDADLLRIRAIVATLRVESALTALRGPAGALFVNGGTSRDAARWAPDQEVRFQITPRNLTGGR